MARPWSRKRRDAANEAPDPIEGVRLDTDDHAWWAQTDVDRAWIPKAREAPAPDDDRETEILAEHFGADWRTSFAFTPPTDDQQAAEAARAQQAIDDEDPYKVLEVEPTATWAEIVAAHRHHARAHHPDRLFGLSDDEQAVGEDRIRVINAAYQELRIRRSK